MATLVAYVIIGVLMIAAIAIIGIVAAIPVYFLWNWLMPDIFGLKTISIIQAWGLVLLMGTLFKSGITFKSES